MSSTLDDMTRGRLRVYLGAAPGVGKTYAMLAEARRRADRGTDVVVGFVETHGRQLTAALLEGLEVVPRRTLTHRGVTFTEMDVDAVLRRRPEVALVDELAHTNVPGSRNAKRWQDIRELLAGGIDVISTVNVQHLESLNDVVETITGATQRETVPDEVVRSADQLELVDMSPEALRRRLAHGNVYAADKIDAALANYFRVGNLTALRELALLWVADRVDEGLRHYRAEHGVTGLWEARERVVVALSGGPEGATLIRRAARIAARAAGGELLAVHVARSDGLTGASPVDLAEQRRLVESMGGSYHVVVGEDIPAALLDFARAENATQLVLGTSRRGRLHTFLAGQGIGSTAIRESGEIDVHMVTHERSAGRRLPRLSRGLTVRRRLTGAALAVVLLPVLTVALTQLRSEFTLPSQSLFYLLAVVVIALVGGLWPALAAAVASSLLLNWFFAPPFHTLTVAEGNNVLALAVFVVVAAMVSSVVDLAARRTAEAARSSAEARTLSALAGDVLRGEHVLPGLLERLRETFGMCSVSLVERGEGGSWQTVGSAGGPCPEPVDSDTVPAGEDLMLVLYGRPLPAGDRMVLAAAAAQAAVALRQQRLATAAEAARPLAEADRVRTALLAAVGHDLRTPLASAKAAVASLRSSDIAWNEHQRAELLATAEESLDRLTRLVENLLDMSRLQAGALSVFSCPVALDEVVPTALNQVPGGNQVAVNIEDSLPEVQADPGLLERVIANLVANALRFSAPNQPPVLTASALDDRVELRVVDRGPGMPENQREQMFVPFQRLGDRDNTVGVGLGLALSRGLTEAMGGTLTVEDTPGGGLTMVVALSPATTRAGS